MSSGNISSLSSTLTFFQRQINLGFALVILIFGVTGCFLNILLFSRRQFRTVSCCTYFLAASVAMFAQVSFYGGTTLYTFNYGHPINYILVFCKVWYYIIQSLSIMFRWTLTAACLDRYALSSTNAHLRRFASLHTARRVVAIIGLISIVFPVHNIVVYGIRAGYCIILYGYSASLYSGIFTIINSCVIPVTIMITCTLLIRRNLTNKRERRQLHLDRQQRTNGREHLQRKRDQQALVMLFAQIIVYIILTIPYVIYGIYDAISLGVPNKSADRLAIERFIFPLTGSVITLFPTVSFYLYTLSSSMYRKELFIMLRSIPCCKCSVNTRRIEPTTHNATQEAITVQ